MDNKESEYNNQQVLMDRYEKHFKDEQIRIWNYCNVMFANKRKRDKKYIIALYLISFVISMILIFYNGTHYKIDSFIHIIMYYTISVIIANGVIDYMKSIFKIIFKID